MITNAEFVSRIVNNLKALSKDAHISRRFILGIGKMKSAFLISQKIDEMTMFKEEGLITTIECFRLEQVEAKTCDIFEFRLCQNLMKSTKKIPEGFFGKNGSSIVSVLSVDGTHVYDYTTPQSYSLKLRNKFRRGNIRYYYVKDGHLYLPESTNELVELRMFVSDKDKAEEVCDCPDKDKTKACKSKWDSEFICPDRFLDLVVRDTLQEVGNFYRSSVEDENGNLDSNQKSQTTQ